jgi:hypothetical protein
MERKGKGAAEKRYEGREEKPALLSNLKTSVRL